MDKREYVSRLANFLTANGKTMNAKNLVNHLNWNDIRTQRGTKYRGGRGIYKLIHATYDWLVANGRQGDATNVAKAFKKPDGTYAY